MVGPLTKTLDPELVYKHILFFHKPMKCHFCVLCTIQDHGAEIKKFCPDFSAEDFTCPVCLEIVFKPMLTDSPIFNSTCHACLMKLQHNDFTPRLALPNYPLRNQLNVFLGRAGLKQDYKLIPLGVRYNPEFDTFREEALDHGRNLQEAVNDFMEFLNDIE